VTLTIGGWQNRRLAELAVGGAAMEMEPSAGERVMWLPRELIFASADWPLVLRKRRKATRRCACVCDREHVCVCVRTCVCVSAPHERAPTSLCAAR
jgi:hypothetical protein